MPNISADMFDKCKYKAEHSSLNSCLFTVTNSLSSIFVSVSVLHLCMFNLGCDIIHCMYDMYCSFHT